MSHSVCVDENANNLFHQLGAISYSGITSKGRSKMIKNTILIIFLFSLFISSNEYAYANEQSCISSDGTPNHKIGNFPTRGNPHKFKKQRIKFCFPKKPIKTDKNKYVASVVGITLTGIPIRPGTADWYDKNSPRKHSKDKTSGLNLEAIRPYEKIFGIDRFNGHVDHRGLYHYHKSNPLLLFCLLYTSDAADE